MKPMKKTAPARLLAATAFAAAFAAPLVGSPALAQMDHSGHGAAPAAGQADAMAGYMAGMDRMMQDMAKMPVTGDADADFLLMMIPHHQSALDMAKVVLEAGDDPETLALARAIITAQEQEIAQMTAMLARLGVSLPQ